MKDERFEWDDEKAARNFSIHGVTFEQARLVFDDIHAVEIGEDRRGGLSGITGFRRIHPLVKSLRRWMKL